MSNKLKGGFKASARIKKQMDKAFLGKINDLGKKHDGKNFSALAVSKELGLTANNFVYELQDFVSENVTTENGWTKATYKEHVLLINEKKKKTYYLRTVGVPDPSMEGGVRIFDFQINKHFKTDFELWLKNKEKNLDQ